MMRRPVSGSIKFLHAAAREFVRVVWIMVHGRLFAPVGVRKP
jgi:hypothetical protein